MNKEKENEKDKEKENQRDNLKKDGLSNINSEFERIYSTKIST